MKNRLHRHRRPAISSLLAGLTLLGATGFAAGQNLPQNPNHGGSITINVNGNVMTIDSALFRDIINWDQFSIGSGYEVVFNIADSSGAVLNRVTMNDPSVIAGTLTSNGTVYIVNPAGIIFTPGAVVDVGGIYAAAGNITDTDFLNGIDRFTISANDAGLEGMVINSGQLGLGNAAAIKLIGRVVHNTKTGHISAAPDGVIALVASTGEVILSELNGHTMVRINGHDLDVNQSYEGQFNGPSPSFTGHTGVTNDGTIETGGDGHVMLGAGDMYSLAIYNTGTINAPGGEANLTAMNGMVYHGPAIHQNNAGPASINADRVTMSGDLIQLGSDMTGSESLFVYDPAVLRSNITLTSPDARFLSTVDAYKAGDQGLTIDGNVFFADAVGGSKALSDLHVLGSTQIDGGLIRTTGGQTYDGLVTLGNHTVLEGSLIAFNDQLDAMAAGQQGLTINGEAIFGGEVGGLTPLAYLIVGGPSAINGGLVQTIGHQQFVGNVTLGQHATLTGSQIVFDGLVNAMLAGQQGLTINGNTIFNGAVGDSMLSFLTVNGTTAINGPSVMTQGDQTYTGAVMLGSDAALSGQRLNFGSTLDGQHALVLNATDFLHFGGNVGMNSMLASLETNIGGTTLIDGQFINVLGDISLNPLGHSGVPIVATIGASGDLTIHSANGSILFGANQKLTALGDMQLEALSGSITIGDLAALGNIQVMSPEIFLQTREPGTLLDADGNLINDLGVDIVAGGQILFMNAPTLLGSGVAQFASSTGQFSSTLDGFLLRLNQSLSTDSMRFDGRILDLAATGPSTEDLAEILATTSTVEQRLDDRVLLDPAQREALERMNLFVRDLRADELRDTVLGRELYDDSAGAMAESPQDRQIALNRLRRESAIMVADRYNSLFLAEIVDPATGETAVQSRAEEIQQSLADAWQTYTSTADGAPTVEGFRAYLEATTQHIEARQYVTSLQKLFDDIHEMGVNRAELQAAVDAVLGPITPDSMPRADFESMIVRVGATQRGTA